MIQRLLDAEYSWEELTDIEQHIMEAIIHGEFDGEFKGVIRIRVEYVPEAE